MNAVALTMALLFISSAYGAVWLSAGGDGSIQIGFPSFELRGNISYTPTPTPLPAGKITTAYLTLNQRRVGNNYIPLLLLAIGVAFLAGYHLTRTPTKKPTPPPSETFVIGGDD